MYFLQKKQETQTFSETYNIKKSPVIKRSPTCSLAKNAKRHISNVLDFYGKTEERREAIIREKIISAFKSYFNNLEETQIHNILFITTKF